MSSTLKKRNVLTLWLVVFALKLCAQAIPQLDTLTLKNGLKIYLLHYGEDSVLTLKLAINGGKKNETACQVGYSEIIQQLISETIREKQNLISKKENPVTFETYDGQTVFNTQCSNRNFNRSVNVISAAIVKPAFRHDKIHRIVSSIIYSYTPENISSYRLAALYRDLILYGAKNPLGRNYCQYQIQKMLPEELREFYFKHYTPNRSSLLICGNFSRSVVKKIIAKQFEKWKPAHHKDENGKCDSDLKMPKIKNREIAFINKRDLKHYVLKWVQSAPSSRSPDHAAFLMVCDLFDHYLADKIKEDEEANEDSLIFKPISYTTDFMEINCVAGQSEMRNAIRMLDTTLQAFSKLKFSGADLEGSKKSLKDKYIKNGSPEAILSFYDPLMYNFDTRKNYPAGLSEVTLPDLQLILKNYFKPDLYKLIIVGKEQAASGQLSLPANAASYQASDFETCDETCIVHSKKKWKKGKKVCCFHCFIRGWCPCMYSPARLQ